MGGVLENPSFIATSNNPDSKIMAEVLLQDFPVLPLKHYRFAIYLLGAAIWYIDELKCI